ncbi:nucleoside-diphosphate-sugar epimerase [Burkholderiales bacterium JOSHI_001]|nr:nucleoside-diphosphate-sugar epimerase [Burkholderiales bacterium JOSHI_001]
MAGRVVVLGGTGFVGRAFAVRAAATVGTALQLVVPTRRLASGQALRSLPTVQLLQARVQDDADLRRVLQGADAVVNLVAILHGREADFEQVHVTLPQRLAAACAAVGVRRLVHVSALGVGLQAPSMYLRSKARGEAVLQQAAAGAGGLELTLLRPSVIFGAEDRFLNLFAALQAVFPVMPLGGAGAQLQPVWVGDVAQALLQCLADRATVGKTFDIAGPQVYTLAQLVKLAGARTGRHRPVLPLPAPLARLQALTLEFMPGGPLMSRDNLASLQVPNVASGTLPGLADLGIEAHSIAQASELESAGAQRDADLERWRRRHGD